MNPAQSRPGEQIGGGYIVLRRGKRTGRIRPSFWAFEHPTSDAAVAEMIRLAIKHPGEHFEVWSSNAGVVQRGGTVTLSDPDGTVAGSFPVANLGADVSRKEATP